MFALLATLLGVLTWTLTEYVMHRFLGHDRRTMPNPFATEHTRHHSEGDYFAPSWKKGTFATAVAAVLVVVGTPLVGALFAGAFAGGFVTLYVAYELVHRRAHTHEGIGGYGRWLRRHHFHHHFENPKANHGVTSPIWDVVFGTYEAPVHIRVPRKLAMRWLCDDEGVVRSAFARFYSLRGA